jgi:hypothetical protein
MSQEHGPIALSIIPNPINQVSTVMKASLAGVLATLSLTPQCNRSLRIRYYVLKINLHILRNLAEIDLPRLYT